MTKDEKWMIKDLKDIKEDLEFIRDCHKAPKTMKFVVQKAISRLDVVMGKYSEMQRMLPDIKQTIEVYRNYRKEIDANDTTGFYDDLLTKIQGWENE